jgi:hypothetical protein
VVEENDCFIVESGWKNYRIRRFDFFCLICQRQVTIKSNLPPMHAYFRNHQLYLAEKCNWLDRQVQKSSKRALMKIESYKLILQSGDDFEQIKLVEKLVKDSLLTRIKNDSVLLKEGFYKYNLDN